MLNPEQLALSLVAGGLTSLSPCVFPLLPLVLGGTGHAHRVAPVVMGLGMVSTFTSIGIILGALGPGLGLEGDTTRLIGAVLLMVFGGVTLLPTLSTRFSRVFTPMANAAHGASLHLRPDTLWGALALGGILGLVWSPCSGPLLAATLTLVATEGGALAGGVMLGAFGLGAAIPLVAIAYASRSGVQRMRGWVGRYAQAIRRGFGLMILLMGWAIFYGGDKWLEAKIVNLMPDAWVNLTIKY